VENANRRKCWGNSRGETFGSWRKGVEDSWRMDEYVVLCDYNEKMVEGLEVLVVYLFY
jgi:hypothetical protein